MTDSNNPTQPQRHAAQIAFEIWKSGPVSRAALAHSLGLSLPTIANAVQELLRKGIVDDGPLSPSTGGRKAQLVDVRRDLGRVVGISFTSRGISAATGDMKGSLRNIRQYPFTIAEGREAALCILEQAIEDQLDAEPEPPKQIGLVVSGLLNRPEGVSLAFPRFEEWTNVPLVARMEKRFNIPTILDSHIAGTTLAELLFGNHRGFNNALYVQLGPGLGMGIVVSGELYRGSGPNVGEFGHISMREEGGPLCYCGNYGCLESLAGDHALVQQAQSGLKEGVQTRLADPASAPGSLSIREVFKAAAGGDRFAINLVERAARLLGTGIANVTNLLGPDIIILGGTMTGAGDLLLDSICNTLHTKALNRVEKHVQIVTDSFGKHDTITGAVATALFHHFSQGTQAWKSSL